MLKIDSNIAEVAGDIEKVARQMPFAMARALTWTAKDAQERVRQELPHRFIIRNTWTSRGITITPAKKKDRVPTAIIGSRGWYMREQEEGATRRPKKAKLLAVPVKVRRNKRGKITPANRPRRLLAKKGYFINSDQYGNVYLWKRKTKKRYPIIPMYLFRPRILITKQWKLKETVGFVVDKRLPRNMRKSLRLALESAR